MGLDIHLMKTRVPEEEFNKNYLIAREKAQAANFLDKTVNFALARQRDIYLGYFQENDFRDDAPETEKQKDWKGYTLHELEDANFILHKQICCR